MEKTLSLLVLAAAAAPALALAGDHAYGPFPADYVEECASCHVAYPPQLLTAPGWQKVMAQLDKHYGVDAGLDPKRRVAIADFLQKNASNRDKHAPTEASARMTRTAWFAREHGPTPPAQVAAEMRRTAPSVSAPPGGRAPQGGAVGGGSFSDCVACHTAAEKGDYSERGLKLPAGWRRIKEH